MDFARTTLALYFLIPFTFTLIRWMFRFIKWAISNIKRICCPCCISPTVGVEEAVPDSESIELEEISSVGEDIVEESAGPEGEIDETSSAAVEDGDNNLMIENGGESTRNSDTELASDENEPFYYEIGSTRYGINHDYEAIQSLHEASFVEISLSDDDDNIVTPIHVVSSPHEFNDSNYIAFQPDFSPENARVDLEPMYTIPIDSIANETNRTFASNSAETDNNPVDESERDIDLNAVEVMSTNPPTVSSNPSRTPSGTLMFVSDVFGRLTTFSKFRFFKRQTNLENISDATLPNISDTETVFVDIGHSDDE
jgi:hypothetical protein